MWGDRSGREPIHAKSPLRLRRTISLIGAAVFTAAVIALVVIGWIDFWTCALALLAVIGVIDAAVITRRIHTQDRGPD